MERLNDVLQAFPFGVQARIGGLAARKAAQLAKAKAQEDAPEGKLPGSRAAREEANLPNKKPGPHIHLKDAIKVRTKTGRLGGVKIRGLLVTLFAGGKGARHANLVEFPWTQWKSKRKIPGNPFLQNAVIKTENKYIEIVRKVYNQQIDKLARELNRGNVPKAWIAAFKAKDPPRRRDELQV